MLPPILEHIRKLGHRIFEKGDFNLNLFGIRATTVRAGKFDDLIGCAYRDRGQWRIIVWEATTDPGMYYLENPLNVTGTAILAPGQYRGAYTVGKHRGQYTALVQSGPVTVYRDDTLDSDLSIDPTTLETGYFGINIHRSSSTGQSTEVANYSAGCQVHATLQGFKEMMNLVDAQIAAGHGDKFTYTLLDQWW